MTMRTKRRYILNEGSYSTGSLLDEDLIAMAYRIAGITDCAVCDLVADEMEAEEGTEYFVECFNDACMHYENEHAPGTNFYFGAHEGDGADFGFWQAW